MIEPIANAARMWQGESLAVMLRQWDESESKSKHDLLIAQAIAVGEARYVADLGCGDGRLALLLPDVEVYRGFDSSPEMIKAANALCIACGKASFTLCDVFEETVQGFDVAVLYDVAIHQKDPIAAIHRALAIWDVKRFICTLLVGPEYEDLYASTVISNKEFEDFIKVVSASYCYYKELVAGTLFDWVVLEIEI